jgi:hypothetical protein
VPWTAGRTLEVLRVSEQAISILSIQWSPTRASNRTRYSERGTVATFSERLRREEAVTSPLTLFAAGEACF